MILGRMASKYAIFDQFVTNFKYISIFGNPDPDYDQDWRTVIFEDLDLTGTYDATKKACSVHNSLDIEVLTSQVGFMNNLQNYVVGARVKSVASEWTYQTNASYPLFAGLSFREVTPDALRVRDSTLMSKIKGNLFYPLNINGASMIASSLSFVALSMSLTIMV